MMKTKLLLVLLVALALVAGTAQANMLLNPSFEEGTFEDNEPPAYWLDSSSSLTSNMTWFDDADGAHSGSRYIKMNSFWSYGSSAWCWQTVNVTPDQEYAFSVWAKCSVAGETSEAWGYYEYLDFTNDVIDSGWLPRGGDVKDVGSNWTHVEFGTATAPASATRVQFSLVGVLENSYVGVLFDDAHMDTPLPSLPFPAWESLVPVGDVELSWTNMNPNVLNDAMYVDVLFGTEPNKTDEDYDMELLTLEPDSGQDVTSVTVENLAMGTYYWRVKSYLEGDPAEVDYDTSDPNDPNAIKGYAWSFEVVPDAPPSFLDVSVDMITWSEEPVALDTTVVDDGESELTYAWSLDNPPGTDVLLTATDIEDPTVTITNVSSRNAMIVNASFEDRLTGWDSFGVWNGTWDGTWGSKTHIYPTDGDWVAYVQGIYGDPIEGAWISQTLVEALTVETTYTLTVDVVNDGFYNEDVQYKVQLLAGETVIAEDDDGYPLNLGSGSSSSDWETSTVVCTLGGPSDPNFAYVGQPLGIRLVAKATVGEMSFDNVHLTADPPFPAPDFATVELTVIVNDATNPTYVLKDSVTIDVYSDACKAAIGADPQATDKGDFNKDCKTNFADLCEMALAWLEDHLITEPAVKPKP